ncbi:MAG: rhomboid family intramembrane serine protease [Desulfobacterales bacterium]
MKKTTRFFGSLKFVFAVVLLLWTVHIVTLFVPLQQFGLIPRKLNGLIGILTAPFLHANFYHLYANTIAILTFGIIFALLEKKNTATLVIEITILQGIALWLFGRTGNHIGASGLIFGLFGYLLLVGYFQRQLKFIIVSLGVLVFYGGTLFGVLPTNARISWEGHLYGFLAGCLVAKYSSK